MPKSPASQMGALCAQLRHTQLNDRGRAVLEFEIAALVTAQPLRRRGLRVAIDRLRATGRCRIGLQLGGKFRVAEPFAELIGGGEHPRFQLVEGEMRHEPTIADRGRQRSLYMITPPRLAGPVAGRLVAMIDAFTSQPMSSR
jgi:hypothetical protein